MYSIVKHCHSGWAYLVILVAVVFLFYTFMLFTAKKEYSGTYIKIAKLATLVFHVQFVLGIFLLAVSPTTCTALENIGETMKNAALRLHLVEHPMCMLAAVILITIANAKIKRTNTVSLGIAALVSIAVLLVLSRIPYNVWLA